MARDALLQLRLLREKRVEGARLGVLKAERELGEARECVELACRTVEDYAARQEEMVAACYAPILGRQKSRGEVMDARADAGEVLLERARLEEAVVLTRKIAETCEELLQEARRHLQRLERRLEALVLLEKKRDHTRRLTEERKADELLDSVSEARWARENRAT
ncbi:MAG: hypothetical protein OD811_00170 [Alphaproteobacteria bacterium]